MATEIIQKMLAQRLPSSTNSCVLYQVPSTASYAIICSLIIANTTAASKTFSVWVNQNGTASADQFALLKDVTLAANSSSERIYTRESGIVLRGNPASILVSASVAAAVNFTIFGIEVVDR